MYQHDPRHVDVLVKDRGLEQGNSLQTAAVHARYRRGTRAIGHDALQPTQIARGKMSVLQPTLCRHCIASVNELCQRMSNLPLQSCAKLKRLVRCLKRERVKR